MRCIGYCSGVGYFGIKMSTTTGKKPGRKKIKGTAKGKLPFLSIARIYRATIPPMMCWCLWWA